MGRGAACAAVVMLVTLTGAASAHARPKLHDGVDGFKVRPAKILVSGDGSGWLGGPGTSTPPDFGRIRWTAFDRAGARGREPCRLCSSRGTRSFCSGWLATVTTISG